MDRKLAHLEMIQAVVTRMASNSFHVKGWSVTLVVALFALAAVDDVNELFVYLAYFPTLMFWALDAYFLREERLFRKLYDHVRILDLAYFPTLMFWALDAYFLREERLFRKLYDHVRILDEGQIDFSMDTSAFRTDVDGTWSVAWSHTLALFHCTLTGSIILVMFLMIVY